MLRGLQMAVVGLVRRRATPALFGCLALPPEIFAQPGLREHVMGLADKVQVRPAPGPDREALLALVD